MTQFDPQGEYVDPNADPNAPISETGDPTVDALLDQPVEPNETLIPRSRVRSLEKKARRVEDAEAQARTAIRELAFTRAGIDTETPVGKMFAQSYQGEMTKEAVLAQWAEVSGTAQTTDSGEGDTQGAALNAEVSDMGAHRGEAASPGAQTGALTPIEPPIRETAMEDAQVAMKKGLARDDAMGGFVNKLAAAAMRGDTSVVIDNKTGQLTQP